MIWYQVNQRGERTALAVQCSELISDYMHIGACLLVVATARVNVPLWKAQ